MMLIFVYSNQWNCGTIVYKCKYFQIHELVPPSIYNSRGEKAWELLNLSALIMIDRLRLRYGSITINNWFWNGNRLWSGLRIPNSPYYRSTSQHSFGRAFDLLFSDVTVDEVRQDILKSPNHIDFKLINAVELNTTWLHIDCRNCNRIKTFTP